MAPTLVVINVPAETLATSNDADFIRDYQWILNNSFHFGKRQWDVLAFVPEDQKLPSQRLHLTRQIIIGKDLLPREQSPLHLNLKAEK
ncbi:MAG: hypothetical protein L3J39_12640 [Verrucomicrobiales bacterium]|nr:hypothetical protein [Verrucomicrobiales bacterium]